MIVSTTPLWLEMHASSLEVTATYQWPLLTGQSTPVTAEIVTIGQAFLTKITSFFAVQTSQTKGWLYLHYFTASAVYRGIWIPESFPSLNTIMKPLIQEWPNEGSNLKSAIQHLFSLRQYSQYLGFFQSEDDFGLRPPPIFVINPQQLTASLLPLIQNISPDDLNIELLNKTVVPQLPDTIISLLKEIPLELDLTLVHLCIKWLYSHSILSKSQYITVQDTLRQLVPELTNHILFSYIIKKISDEELPEPTLIELFENNLDHMRGMAYILLLRLLSSYHKATNHLAEEERYYEMLLTSAPKLSWQTKLDLINAQLGLSRTAVLRGDYFRAMNFYAFARQGFALLGSAELTDELETEYQRISVLAASQQIQAGLFQINHTDASRSAMMTLIDGIQNGLGYYLRYEVESKIEAILPPLLHSGAMTIKLHKSKFVELFTQEITIDELIITTQLLGDPQYRTKIRTRLQNHIEELSFKDQKMIERIAVFYADGRHIGDYLLSNGKFKQIAQDPNQSLFSSAMSAVSMIVAEATQTEASVDEISVGNKKVIYQMGQYLTFCLITKSSNSNLKKLLKKIVTETEIEYRPFLSNWGGNLSLFNELADYLYPLSFFTIDLDEE